MLNSSNQDSNATYIPQQDDFYSEIPKRQVMLMAFLLSLLCLAAPPLLYCLYKRRSAELFPLVLAAYYGFWGLGACFFYEKAPFGWGKLFLLMIFSLLGVHLVFIHVKSKALYRFFTWKRVLLIAGVSLIFNLDLFAIFLRQGWPFADGALVSHNEAYFRAPFNSDILRNTTIIRSLLDFRGSPFFPNTPLTYQVFWHYLFSVFAFAFDYPSFFQVALGFQLTTSLLFSFIFISTLVYFRPSYLLRLKWLLGIGALLFFHADIFNFIISLIYFNRAGIEADWSMIPTYFRNFTIKLLAMTSPQHLSFLLFACGFLLSSKRFPSFYNRLIFSVFSFLCSPILALVFYTVYFASEFIFTKKSIKQKLLVPIIYLVVAVIFYAISMRNPWDILVRPGVNKLTFLSLWPQVLLAPFVLVASLGVAGTLASLYMFNNKRRTKHFYFPSILLFATFFQFLVTSFEVRRHIAILLALIVPLFLVLNLPHYRNWLKNKYYQLSFFAVLFVAGTLHLYFIYCFTGKPSSMDPTLPWKDYFAINDIVRNKLKISNVLVANEFIVMGVNIPPLFEVVSSYVPGGHAEVHSKLTKKQMSILSRLNSQEDILPYAEELGFKYLIWGPVEDSVWGEVARKRFINDKNLLARVGLVSLYKMEDVLKPNTFSMNSLAKGQYFLKHYWYRQAMDCFLEVLETDLKSVEAYEGMGKALMHYRREDEARDYFEKVLSLDANRYDSYYSLSLIEKKEEFKAEYYLNQAINLKPNDPRAIIQLARVKKENRKYSEAVYLIKHHHLKSTEATHLLAQSLFEMKKNEEAKLLWMEIIQNESNVKRLSEAYYYLGRVQLDLGRLDLALSDLRNALALNRENIKAHIYIAEILTKKNEVFTAASHLKEVKKLDPNLITPTTQWAMAQWLSTQSRFFVR